MDTQQMTSLLDEAGLGGDLVYEGPAGSCPHCADHEAPDLADAA